MNPARGAAPALAITLITDVDVAGCTEVNQLNLLDGPVLVGVEHVKQLVPLRTARHGSRHRELWTALTSWLVRRVDSLRLFEPLKSTIVKKHQTSWPL